MSASDPLRVAVIGSGPAGIYTADALTRQSRESVAVDLIDRLPTPYGLVRYGVAPDHTKIKGVARALREVLERPQVRFLGGVEFGRDLTREDLARSHHAVVYATGSPIDRRLAIPGEELSGSVAATDFVNWYSGHPDAAVERFLLDAEEVAVVGVGNVALDVVRMLTKTPDELRATDIPQPVLEVLERSRVRRVHLIGRRGPAHAKFTANELRELGKLEGTDVVVDPAEVDFDVNSEALLHASRAARTNLSILHEWAERPVADHSRRVELRFWLRPTAIHGQERVCEVELERTELDDGGRVVGTGQYEKLPVGMVVRSVGYAGLPLPGVPFDTASRTVPHENGRVLDSDGAVVFGDYVAGWIKRGPTGVIGTNKSDAAETVRGLVDDAPRLRRACAAPLVPVERVLDERGAAATDYDDWLAIDAAEAALGAELGRGERVKLSGWDRLYRAARG